MRMHACGGARSRGVYEPVGSQSQYVGVALPCATNTSEVCTPGKSSRRADSNFNALRSV